MNPILKGVLIGLVIYITLMVASCHFEFNNYKTGDKVCFNGPFSNKSCPLNGGDK